MFMQKILSISLAFFVTQTFADNISVTIYNTSDNKKNIGTVEFEDTPYGLLIKPNISSLIPGLHGFHIHQNPNCNEHGNAAGSHLDPNHTNSHLGPYGNGHIGDLPALFVDSEGRANTPTLAPRLKTENIKNAALMIHQGPDNYSNTPPMGGGGERMGCGVIL